MSDTERLKPRTEPVQKRALERREAILRVTALLLEEVGQDDLTTILVAKRADISVGTLYHYFPNKYAILNALGEQWLGEIENALVELEAFNVESLSLRRFVDKCVERILDAYTAQQGLLPLVRAIYGVPQLKQLDSAYNQLVISAMARMFERLEVAERPAELARLARAYHEISHSLLLLAVSQGKADSLKTLNDLKYLTLCLLERAKSQF
jgi:AcrR family transcriptional regulator